jgi:hypothetical protein
MQARGVTPTSLDPNANRLREFVYQVAILAAVILVLWTVA